MVQPGTGFQFSLKEPIPRQLLFQKSPYVRKQQVHRKTFRNDSAMEEAYDAYLSICSDLVRLMPYCHLQDQYLTDAPTGNKYIARVQDELNQFPANTTAYQKEVITALKDYERQQINSWTVFESLIEELKTNQYVLARLPRSELDEATGQYNASEGDLMQMQDAIYHQLSEQDVDRYEGPRRQYTIV